MNTYSITAIYKQTMISNSMKLFKTQTLLFGTTGLRGFANRGIKTGDRLADNFSFPKHREIFNDEYYEGSNESPFAKDAPKPNN